MQAGDGDGKRAGGGYGRAGSAGYRDVARVDSVVSAGLLQYFQGDHLAIVNLSPTSADRNADLCIPAKVGEVFGF